MGNTYNTGKKDKQESQMIEWKWSWQDEYLKWLCGYANTEGGTLYIGVNDDGYVVGIEDSKEALESLPNKVRDKLGILGSFHVHTAIQGTNLRYGSDIPKHVASKLINQYACGLIRSDMLPETDRRHKTLCDLEKNNPIWKSDSGEMDYIEISVPAYPFAISCAGKYYKRSGSTLQELNGLELQNFLLERAGMTWDAVPMPQVKVEDLSKEAIEAFCRNAIAKGRMSERDASAPAEVLLKNMKAMDPERFVTGAYIKIGYFAPAGAYGENKADDIIYDDTVHGPLILQVEKAMDYIYTKYLKALISYNGLHRVETFLWPREAFREVLLNAVNHKAYEKGIPIQIRIYEDKITIWNDGLWPEQLDVSRIYERHPSLPHNPKMADIFYRSGEIESWGSGFDKIKLECDKSNAPYPVINANPHGGIELECDACDLYMKLLKHGRYYDTYPVDEKDDQQQAESVDQTADAVPLLTPEEQKSVDRMMEILSRELSEKEKPKLLPIVDYLKTYDVITRREAESVTGKSASTVTRYLNRLESLNVIRRDGQSVSMTYKRV